MDATTAAIIEIDSIVCRFERSTFSVKNSPPPSDNGLNFSHSSRHIYLVSRSVTYIPHGCSRIRSENSKHETISKISLRLSLKFLITKNLNPLFNLH